ncbi:reverse transcriptase family protein [Priestia megaterium]|uniref:reverse transcriptase family protein n=1 Tax=Priestia megaterium TaxID=1404 RepID=UPI002E1D6761|nr:reverse transcriptase family protein [Priestia megaterium]
MANFNDCKLYGITNKKYLSELLHVDLKKLKNVEEHYNTSPFFKQSSSGKTRILYNPHPEYKKILKRLNLLLKQILPPEYIYGGIKNRSYVMNADVHTHNEYLLSVDLKDFFPSTSDKYVYKFFKNKLCMSEDIAKICTLLTTESLPGSDRRHLPQGYTTSPYLSFLSYFDMYNGIYTVARNANMNFSCYYDDFTFSASTFINKSFKNRIISIIQEHDLQVNKNKTRLSKTRNKGIKITGSIIHDDKLKSPNSLQKEMYKTFENLILIYETEPLATKKLITMCNKVQGMKTAIKSIEKQRQFPYIDSKVKEIREFTKRRKNKKTTS